MKVQHVGMEGIEGTKSDQPDLDMEDWSSRLDALENNVTGSVNRVKHRGLTATFLHTFWLS